MGQQPSEGKAVTLHFVLLVHRPELRTLVQNAFTISLCLDRIHFPITRIEMQIKSTVNSPCP